MGGRVEDGNGDACTAAQASPAADSWAQPTTQPTAPHHPTRPPTHPISPRSFRAYTRIVETRLMPKYNAAWHWAKLEAGAASGRPEAEMAAVVRPRLAARYGPALAALKRYRAVLDPAGTCGSDWTDAVIGPAPQQGKPQGVEAGKGEGAEK